MKYSDEQLEKFGEEYRNVCAGLEDLMMKVVIAGQATDHVNAREHLLHGVSRRLGIIKKSIENVFCDFPPDIAEPLARDTLYNVQINLQAYVMNLYGIFDNWAWAFVHRFELLEQVGGKHGVGLFKKNTKNHLPIPVREYLSTDKTIGWHEKYLKSYRDALAHRIPLYIPPSEVTPEEGERYNQLEAEKIDTIKSMNWSRLEEIEEEQGNIGRPSFVFLHSYEEEKPRPVLLHPQILCDGLTVVEFGLLFMEHWDECA